MGHLSLFLLISFPFLVLGNYPLTFFDSTDGTPDVKAKNTRVEGRNTPYFAVFTAFKEPIVQTYHQPSAPKYQSYNNIPSYGVTPYEQPPQVYYESAPKVFSSENIPAKIPTTYPTTTQTTTIPTTTTKTTITTTTPTTTTTSTTTTKTTPPPTVTTVRNQYQLPVDYSSSKQSPSNKYISSSPSYQINEAVHLNDVTSYDQQTPVQYEAPSTVNVLEDIPEEKPALPHLTTTTDSTATYQEFRKPNARPQSPILNVSNKHKAVSSNELPTPTLKSSSPFEQTYKNIKSYEKHTQVQYESAPRVNILKSIPVPIQTPPPTSTTTTPASQFYVGTERLERSLYPYSGVISTPKQPPKNSYLSSVYRDEPPTTTAITILPPTFEEIYGFDLAKKTRQEADALILYLSQLDQNQKASNLIRSSIESNVCLDSLKDMMDLLEGGTRVIEIAGEELEQMLITVNGLRNVRNITQLVRGSADLLIQLDNVFPKLETFTFLTRCRSPSSSQNLQSLRDQAQILYSLSFVSDFKFTQAIKDNLFQSAIITEVITNFLDHLGENIARQDCFTQNDFLGEGTLLAAQIMDDLAEALGVLGYFPTAREARQYATFTRSIAANLGKLKQFRIPDDCSPGALRRAAGYLNDLANLIDEVGLLELGVNLGLVFRLDLLP